jgi:16S rRNA (uracil1498-N3)-methyltransferase
LLAQPPTADLRLVLWEQADQTRTLKQTLGEQPSAVQSAVVVIGPEGGLTAAEVEQLCAHGYQPVSLGKRILRTETAGLVVLGILQYLYGDY